MKHTCKLLCAALMTLPLAATTTSTAAELDPKAVVFKLPDQTLGHCDSGRQSTSGAVRDPSKPGYTAADQMAGPAITSAAAHFHPNDRYITVLSGTWWVGSGPDFDPNKSSVPMPAGSVVTHYAKQVHWDGAKDTDAVLLIVGEGPATSTPFVAAPAPTNR